MKRLILTLLLAFLLIACQEAEPVDPTPAGDLEAVGPVTVTAEDGTPLSAEFIPGVGDGQRPSVLFVHMVNSDLRAWDELALQLTFEGINTLAFDLRGHGETGGSPDWEASAADVQVLYQYLRQRPETDPSRTAIVGASIGANLALVTAAEESGVDAVVALSPGLDYQGIETLDVVSGMSGVPLLLVASSEDAYAFESAQTLNQNASTSELVSLVGAGHGTEMLGNAPGLNLAILTWLSARWR